MVTGVQLNVAVSKRLSQLLEEKKMTMYQLFVKSGIPRSTISNIINCTYPSVKLRVIYELCQGLDISLEKFFASPIFDSENLDP